MGQQSLSDASSAAAPAAGTAIASVTIDQEWTYLVEVQGWQGGTFDSEPVNLHLLNDGVEVAKILSVDHPSLHRLRVYVQAAKTLELKVIADAGAGSIYAGSIAATRVARHVSSE